MLPRILVAGTADAIDMVKGVLGEEAELVVARSVEEAVRQIEANLRAVVCNLRFDDSRMFNFLQALREHPAGAALCVVSIRTGRHALSPNLRHSITNALDALGVDYFVDLQQLTERYGEEVARETLRQILLGQSPANPDHRLSSAASRS